MRKYSFALVRFIALVAVALVFGAQPSQSQGQEEPPPLVNIEIFTDMTYPEVRAEMNMIREQLGARCDTIDVEPVHCQVTIDRWEAFTGRKAVKAGDAVRA